MTFHGRVVIVTAPRRKRRSFRGLIPRLQPKSQNIRGGVVVPVFFHPAARTGIGPVGQSHLLPVTAGGAVFGRIGRVDLPESRPALSALYESKEKNCGHATSRMLRFRHRVGVHFVEMDVLHEDPSGLLHDLRRFLCSGKWL